MQYIFISYPLDYAMKIFVWSRDYWMDLGGHIFPTHKFGLIHEKMLREGIASEDEFVKPELISDKELEIVHTREHIERLRRLSRGD